MSVQEIKTSLTDAVGSLGSKIKDPLSFLKEMREASSDKIKTLVNDILGLAPLIEVTGFCMKDLSVDVGIPPGIKLSFTKERDVDPATIEKLLKENEDKTILTLIVKGLQKADAMQKEMNLSYYNFRGLSMKIGLPPDISLKFSRIEKAGPS